LMAALPQTYGDIAKRMTFDDAKMNFFRAARHGLDAQFQWLDGESHSAPTLILNHLLPLARQGLMNSGVATSDVDKYLDIIKARSESRQTGAMWIMKSLSAMDDSISKDTRQRKLVAAMLANQKQSQPIHRWPIIEESDSDEWENGYRMVGQFMSTDLFTVKPDDLIDLAASVMDWRHIRHVPVEDEDGRVVGLVTHRGLLRILNTSSRDNADDSPTTVREVMVENPVTVAPSTSSLEAIQIMRSNRVGCLPVVENNQLVGIVTSYDFLEASARLFQQHLAPNYQPKSRGAAQGG